jgi:hypothetical protein
MPSSSGPNTVNDSIIFTYDTGDLKNSFKGKPATNLLTNIANTYGTNNSSTFKTFYYNRTLYVPQLGTTTVTTLNNYNDYNGGSGVCCEQIFSYGTGISVSGNTLYTYSIIYRSATGYTHPNMMYRYEYGPGGYQTEGGVFNNSNRTDLGEGWYHAWGTFTTQPNTTSVNTYNFIYEYATYNVIDIAAAMLIQGNFILPPANFIPFNTTRNNTQGLLDISGNGNSISLANSSFDSSGQIFFDGTDDFITLGSDINFKTTGGWTVESVVYYNSVAGSYNNVTSPANFIGSEDINYNSWYWSVLENKLALWNISPGYWRYGSTTLQPNTWYHVALVSFDGGSKYQFYLNGVAEGGDHVSQVWNSSYSGLRIRYIGKGNNTNTRVVNGKIPITKAYNRALTPSEILNNYTEYRKRFDLPVYTYIEGSNATPYLSNWNNSTTYTMADFGGIPNVTAHGWSTGPATYTLTLNNLPPHTKVRYKVFWHLVDSLDNETNQLFIMNLSGGETEILRFTKQYNLTPAISIAASPGTYTWSGSKSYTYRPWAGGAYGQDGYIIVDSGLVDHTSSTFTARHVMGADQGQSDEAEYLSHVLVELY